MPSQSDWESQKDVIRDLYLNQDLTLKALRERMDSNGFIATKSQYETKFKAWGFSKNSANIPAATWKHVGYKVEKRKRENEDSTVLIDGVLVDQKRLRKEISRYFYSTAEKIELENIGAPSPPGPLATVATPPSSKETFIINPWPENLPWLAFVRSLNTHLAGLHQSHVASRASQQGRSTPQSKAQHVFSSSNTDISILGLGRKSTYSTTRRDRLELIQSILPHSSDSNRTADIHNSMSLLSTTSSHWALKLLIYLASNNLLWPTDLPTVWRLVEETGVKGWINISMSLELGETSLKAAMECLFGAGVRAYHTDIVSWLLDLGIDANKMISSHLGDLHLPLVIAMSHGSWEEVKPIVRLLLLNGASPLLRCCKGHNTATHMVIFDSESQAESLELLSQAIPKTDNRDPGSRSTVNALQGDGAEENDCERQRSEDEICLKLESLVDLLETSFPGEPPSWATLASPKALIQAVEDNNHNLIRIIHKRGVSMNSYVDVGCYWHEYPLEVAVERARYSTSTVELLLELGALPNYNPDIEWRGTCSRALQTAVQHSPSSLRAELIRTLIEHGAAFQGSVQCQDESHRNLMDLALDTEAMFVKLAADDDGLNLALEAACMDMEALEALHDAGLPLPETSLILNKILHMVWEEDPDKVWLDAKRLDALIQFLAPNATDFTLQSKKGWTALDYTVCLEMEEARKLMFGRGAVHSRKFLLECCFFDEFPFNSLEAMLRRVPTFRSEKQKRSWLFYRVVGTMRAGDLFEGDMLATSLGTALRDYRELSSSPKYEAYIILQACLIRNVPLIGHVLELFPNAHSPAALEELIWCDTQTNVDYWKYIEDLLRRRSIPSSYLQRPQENRLFFQVALHELTGKGNPKVLEWLRRFEKEALDRIDLHSSAVLMDVLSTRKHSDFDDRSSTANEHRESSKSLRELNISQLCKHGLTTNTYLGLLMVAQGQQVQLNVLMHHGLHLNRRFPWSFTMLQFAVAQNNLIVSRKLLEAGANVDARGPWRDIPEPIGGRIQMPIYKPLTVDGKLKTKRRTALQLAVEQGNLSIIRLLLEFGANVNEPPARVGGATSLQLACIKGFIDIVRLLVQEGGNVNAVGADYFGRTALEGAAEHGRLDIVFFLLGSGCSVYDSFRKQYIRAVGFARARVHHTVATELQKYGDWTDEDEVVLRSTNLEDVQPETRNLEEELDDDEEVSEIDPEEFLSQKSDLFPPEMLSESESEDHDSSSDDEDEVMLPDEGCLQAQVNEVGISQHATEPSTRRLIT